MSIAVPSRRIAGRCLFCQPLQIRPRIQHQQQRTAASNPGNGDDEPRQSNPVLDAYKIKHGVEPSKPAPQQMPKAGDLSASSIFEDDRRMQSQRQELTPSEEDVPETSKVQIGGVDRDAENMANVLDPDPNARERWERKKVIQMVRKGGRLNAQQMIKRTEREHLVRSHNMKTSVKKLGMLARQISGKTLEDAITQMRFSKKRVAQEVLKQLQYARDEAVVMRGMGLGAVEAKEGAHILNDATPAATNVPTTSVLAPTFTEEQKSGPVQIQLKDGKRHLVTDASKIYIDQAWVGRGPFGKLPDYRARGRVYIMRTPWTSLSVLLKEEKTRVRLHEEREEKRRKKILDNVWTHLPDRPVQWQRQWYAF
ncbi:39S ribosomal protein L22, mitochondrial [Recurvomyces mirabilis]|uniref:39S ribosomal protein L22, mitochondrial n=1 Tax=Recurvomyces mirabilis TaxID=574656 RepID=A0AAE0WWD5_9PEZI|nr:39S ribosomal protein L22, mitochondrial [Recurvomyces mirabilis]KAK5161501.1 39S ribosomal protein L22, mitochondrial [Recurvomyces mirabilis]